MEIAMAVRSKTGNVTGRNRFPFTRRLLIAGFVLAGMAMILAGCGREPAPSSSSETSGGFDSPQAVFDAEKQALANDDSGALFDLYAPHYQDMVVSGIAFGAVAAASAMGKQNELREVFQKHGVDESQIPKGPSTTDPAKAEQVVSEMEKQQAELVAAIGDKRAFFVDILAWLEDLEPAGESENKQREAQKMAQASAKLTDVEITGDSAVANREITIDGSTDNVPAFFVRIDGSWYLHQGTAEGSQ